MSGSAALPEGQADILDLIDRMEAAEARLMELTGGQVDTVVGRSGRRHLLPIALGDLMQSASTFRNIFRHAAVGIISTDAYRRLREANPTFCAMMCETEAALLDADVVALIAPEHVPDFLARVGEIERGERRDFVVEQRFRCRFGDGIRCRAGDGIWSRVSVSALYTPLGGYSGLIVIVEDISGRRDAEADNRRLGGQLVATMASFPDPFFTLDTEFHFGRINDAAAQLFAAPGKAALGQPIWALEGFGPDAPFGLALRQAALQRTKIECQAFLESGDRWLQMRAYGSAEGLIVSLQDVTERRQRRERLHLLETSLAWLSDIVIVTEATPIDLPGPRIVYVNDAFERCTGYSFDEVRGRTPRLLQGPKTQPAELARIRAAIRAQRPVHAELINYTRSGEEFWVEMDIAPVTDAAGAVTHHVAVQRDITERKRIQAELEQQAALLDLVQDSVIVRDMAGRIRYWNRGAERIFGWTAEEAVGQRVQEFIYFDPADSQQPGAAVLMEGRWNGQVAVRRKDGSRRIVDARLTLIRDPDGSPHSILAIKTDITERLEMEDRLHQSQRLEAVGQLTGGIAHDFNNLLTVVLGNAEMLTDSLGEADPMRPIAEMMVGAAERGAALTSQLLAFSRRQALVPKTVDVNRLLTGLGEMIRRTLGEHIEIQLLTGPKLSSARIDPLQLENAVLNLCINARDAMPNGGRLTIETADVELDAEYVQAESEVDAGHYVMIAVSDAGAGMAPETLARAFEPFFTTKEVGRGSGLGLSMVFGFMKQSGGHVKIYSELGIGTVVKIYLPSERRTVRAAGPTARAHHAALRGGAERLLLVEDNDLVRQHVASQLRQLGYGIVEAADALKALHALREEGEFDLLFTDVVMPGGMNGPELAAEAKRLRPGLRVLFSSGYTEGASGLQGLLEPRTTLLQKPYRRKDLAEAIRSALDGVA